MVDLRRWGVVAVGTVVAVYAALWSLRFALHAILDMVLAVVALVVAVVGVRAYRSARRDGLRAVFRVLQGPQGP